MSGTGRIHGYQPVGQGLQQWRAVAWVLCAVGLAAGCGPRKIEDGPRGPSYGPVEGAFVESARASGIPMRYLLAAGYLESRLSPTNATANYLTMGKDDRPKPRGTLMTQTAFGLTFKDLGLDPAKDTSQQLPTQVPAYGQWLQAKLQASGVKLAADPRDPQEHFHWIENLALLHRRGLAQRRNVQILFARELIRILNEGFTWQDPETGERVMLEPQTPPIDINAFAQDGKNWFAGMSLLDAELHQATYLPLVTVPSGEFVNQPRRIEVIHCPLALSACLELQTRSQESDVRIAAHYVVPPVTTADSSPDPMLNRILQVADHKDALVITSSKGQSVPIEDAIVIMLVGNSGRSVGGERIPAVPTWFTDLQLRAMGQLVNDLCTLLAQKDSGVNRDACMASGGQKGVTFHHQAASEELRWGDIADFDPNIFGAYLRNPGGLGTEVAFTFESGDRRFVAGSTIPLQVLFDSSARQIVLERLSRCPNRRVVWEPLRIEQVRGEHQSRFLETLHDSGPNHNGEQFFRVRVYGKDGHLMGWAIDQVFQSGFESDAVFASDETCRGAE